MTKQKIVSILGYINSLYPEFKIPDNPDNMITIWREALEGIDDKIIHNAIKKHYTMSRWHPHLSDIVKMCKNATEPALPEPSEVVDAIRVLAMNSRQSIDGKPEYIKGVIKLMGGLENIGRREWNTWLEKDICRIYEEWKSKVKYHEEQSALTTGLDLEAIGAKVKSIG